MQRTANSFRSSSRLCECIRNPSSLRHLPPRSSQARRRQLSISRFSASPLPVFDFLHPPVVHDAVRQTERISRLVRQYHHHDGNDDDPIPPEDSEWPSSEGWSTDELERQEKLHQDQRSQSPPDALHRLFNELDSVPNTQHPDSDAVHPLPEFANDPKSDYVPLIGSTLEAHLLSMKWLTEPVSTRYYSDISMERHSALDAFRVIVGGDIDGKQQQALDIYRNNDLSTLVTPLALTRYLYRSTQRRHLEELLRIDEGGALSTATLCRLGRLEEAARVAIQRLNEFDSPQLCVEVLLVMEAYAKRKDWQGLVKVWEEAILSPSIDFPNQLLSEQTRNVTIENCLFTIPNVKEWYFEKYKEVYNTPGPRRRRQWVKNFCGILVKAFANNNDWVTAMDLIQFQIRVFGWVNQNTFFDHLVGLRVNGRPKEAVEMYLQYRNNEFSPVIHPSEQDEKKDKALLLRIQNEALASASLLNNFPVLRQIFEDIYTLELEPDHYSYAIIMHAFARHGQKKEVETLFDTFVQSGRQPNIFMYAEMLYVNVTLLDIPGVEKVFDMITKSQIDPNSVIYDMSTMAYTRTLDVENSMRMFQEFVRAGNAPTTKIIGHLISMFAYRHDTEGAVEMFNLVGEFGLSPTTSLFNQLLNAYAVAGDTVNAEAVIVKMRDVGVAPDVVTWTTLMKLYVLKRDTYAIVDTLARLRRSGCEPDEHTWAQLMESFARDGGKDSLENCRRIMRRMEAVGLKPNVHHWNNLLEATAVNTGDMELMQQVYDEMLNRRIRPNSATQAILVGSYCKYGGRAGLEVSEGIIERLKSISRHLDLTARRAPRTTLSPALFAPIFKSQGPNLPPEQVQEVFDGYINSTASVGGSPAEPDLVMLTALLEVYRYHNDIDAVHRVWIAIKKHADAASRSFRATSERAAEFVVPGNRYLLCRPFSQYMIALASADQLDELDKVWDQLSQEGYDFDCENWNTRIRICLKRKKHIVWAFRACEEVLMDGWESKLRFKRKKIKNPPKFIRNQGINKKLVDRIFWPIEADLLDIEPPPLAEREKLGGNPEFYPFQLTLLAFIKLRRELLLGASIVDSSGRRRPGVEVWERLKQAFPRIVRAMYLHLKRLNKSQQRSHGVFINELEESTERNRLSQAMIEERLEGSV